MTVTSTGTSLKNDKIVLKKTKKYGRGLYATSFIKAGTVVEISPVIELSEREQDTISSTVLGKYVFEWEYGTAVALGLGSLFNHNKYANVWYRKDFINKSLVFITTRDIPKGKQLFIDYGYDPLYPEDIDRVVLEE